MINDTTKKQPRIAIIGGGPGGLTLALILQKHGLASTIYEREALDPNASRGGSLDIHEDSGQWALKEAGLLEQFHALARYEGEDFRLFDKHGTIYMDDVADAEASVGGRPEIDRGTLWDLLLGALNSRLAAIRYGHKLLEAVPLADGRHELRFENGFTDTADLVIGADGAFSRVRPLLTDAAAAYSGLTMVELHVHAAAHPEIAAFNARGKMFALDDHKAILGQLNGEGRIKVYASFRAERDWLDTCGIPFNQPEEAKRQLLQLFEDWNKQLKDYIRCADDVVLPRRIYMLPVGLQWESKPGVTLIGDAAHLMSPFAGEGVNLAMKDAATLALAVVRHIGGGDSDSGGDNLDHSVTAELAAAIQEYEAEMYAYSSESAKASDDNLKLIFAENAAINLKNLFDQLHRQHAQH